MNWLIILASFNNGAPLVLVLTHFDPKLTCAFWSHFILRSKSHY